MDSLHRQVLGGERAGYLVFVVSVVVAYLVMFSSVGRLLDMPTVAALIIAGVAFMAIGVYGFAFCERTHSMRAAAAYFAVQIGLGLVIEYLGRGAGWLLLLPIAAQSITLLPRPGVLLVCTSIVAALGVSIGLENGWAVGLQAAAQYTVAVVFVVAFTHIAFREQNARIEIERLATELGEANRKLREYAAQAEELAATRERNRMAREIHDSLGHYLTAVNMQIEAARAVLDRDRSHALDALAKAQSLTKEGLAEVRRSVAALRASPMENRPLPEALAQLVDECRADGLSAELTVTGAPRPLSAQAELTLYRVAQEGLTNVRKHAQARHADVTLEYGGDARVRLAIWDDGAGADEAGGGFGLLGVRERVQLLGGQVNIHTAAGQGFGLEVELPG